MKAKGCVSFPGLPSHKTTGCKTTEMYPLTVLKVKSWKPRYQPAVSKAPGRNHARPPCWLLVAASGAWRPWLAVALLQSLPESPCGFVSASSSLSYKDLTHRIEGTLEFSTTSSELFNNCICKHSFQIRTYSVVWMGMNLGGRYSTHSGGINTEIRRASEQTGFGCHLVQPISLSVTAPRYSIPSSA